MKVYANYKNKWITDITPFIKNFCWSGDVQSVARKVDITIAYAVTDMNHRNTQIGCGTKIWIIDETKNNKQIFYGIVWDREILDKNELTFTAFDYLIYLLQSTVTYNFKKITSYRAVETIIKHLGLKYNRIPTINNPLINRITQEKTAYEAIMEIYTIVSKQTGQKFIPICDGVQISVIEKGKEVVPYTLKYDRKHMEGNNVLSVSYKDTMEGVVNKVIVNNKDNRYVTEVKRPQLFAYYGILQKVYTIEDKVDYKKVAQNMLKGISAEIEIEAVGDWECITGHAIKSEIDFIDILQDKILYIESDEHNYDFNTGLHTMKLSLSFHNSMDYKEGDKN